MHHAQLLIGSYAWAGIVLPEVLRSEGEDVRHYRGVRMGIDEARTIIYEAYLKPIQEDKRSFIIAYAGLTLDAQNALLKLLEDPPVTAQFFIIIDREELLIPTVRSRLLIVAREDIQAIDAECLDFFTFSVAERLTLIANRMKNKDDVWAREMIRAIEEKAYTDKNIPVLKTLDELRPFYDTQGASRKMILEHLALML
jgi:DNA polymerase III delta prime subunit